MKNNKIIFFIIMIVLSLLFLTFVSANDISDNNTNNNIQKIDNNKDTIKTISKSNTEKTVKTETQNTTKSDVTIKSSDVKTYSTNNISLKAYYSTSNSSKINISNSILKIDDKTVTNSKVVNGVAIFNFTVPTLKEGIHNITIKIGNTTKFNEASIDTKLTIYRRNLTVTASNVSSFAGKTMNVTAKVTGADNINLTKALLKIAGKTVASTQVTNGVAKFSLTTPNLRKGTYDMQVIAQASTLYNLATVTKKINIYRNNLTISATNLYTFAGKSQYYTVNITSNGYKSITNIPAILKIAGKTVSKSKVTNGKLTFNFTVPTLKKGSYDMLIKIGESTYYNPANKTKTLTVYAQNVTITANHLLGYAGQKTNLIAKFVSGNKTNINISSSVLKIDGKTVARQSVVNGVANYSFVMPSLMAGSYIATIKSGESTLYNQADASTTVTVLENSKVSVVGIKVSSTRSSTTSGRLAVSSTTTAKGNYYTSSSDTNAVLVQNGGVLSLVNSTVKKTGNQASSNSEDSEFYGTNAAVLVTSKSVAYIANTSIVTNATGANAVFSSNLASSASGATINMSNVNISTYKDKSRGLDATYGGIINAEYVTINTRGGSCAALATDRGEGTVNAYNCVLNTGVDGGTGQGSPCIYSTGAITAVNCTGTASSSQIACIEGKNSITLNGSNLSCSAKGNRQSSGAYVDLGGIFIYQSMSGDADVGTAQLNAQNSVLTILSNSTYYKTAPMFHVTNTAAKIYLTNCTLNYGSGVLLNNSGQDQWGRSGSNGGKLTFVATNQVLTGNIYTDKISSTSLTLKSSSLKGAINPSSSYGTTSVTLSSGSTWTLTGNSHVSSLSNSGTINYGSYTLYVNGVAYTATNPY